MRVIAGSARRLNLMTPKGTDVRPTTDRIKETLFNMIQDQIPGCRFLDLFAGSGGIGIEALSRGASYCVFADADKRSVSCVKNNLAHTHLENYARVFMSDYRKTLSHLRKSDPFDIIFLDPPYEKGMEIDALRLIHDSNLLADGGMIIIETTLDTEYMGCIPSQFSIVREKKYKTNKHVFLRKEIVNS